MDYKKLIHRLIATERLEKNYNSDYSGIYSDAANAITDLLARAEAAEARAEKAEREKNDAINLLKRVNDKTGNCYGCKYFDIEREVCTDMGKKFVCDCRKNNKNNFWEWHGIKED